MTVSAGIVPQPGVIEQHVNAWATLSSDLLYRTIDRDRVTHIGLNKLGNLEDGFFNIQDSDMVGARNLQ